MAKFLIGIARKAIGVASPELRARLINSASKLIAKKGAKKAIAGTAALALVVTACSPQAMPATKAPISESTPFTALKQEDLDVVFSQQGPEAAAEAVAGSYPQSLTVEEISESLNRGSGFPPGFPSAGVNETLDERNQWFEDLNMARVAGQLISNGKEGGDFRWEIIPVDQNGNLAGWLQVKDENVEGGWRYAERPTWEPLGFDPASDEFRFSLPDKLNEENSFEITPYVGFWILVEIDKDGQPVRHLDTVAQEMKVVVGIEIEQPQPFEVVTPAGITVEVAKNPGIEINNPEALDILLYYIFSATDPLETPPGEITPEVIREFIKNNPTVDMHLIQRYPKEIDGIRPGLTQEHYPIAENVRTDKIILNLFDIEEEGAPVNYMTSVSSETGAGGYLSKTKTVDNETVLTINVVSRKSSFVKEEDLGVLRLNEQNDHLAFRLETPLFYFFLNQMGVASDRLIVRNVDGEDIYFVQSAGDYIGLTYWLFYDLIKDKPLFK